MTGRLQYRCAFAAFVALVVASGAARADVVAPLPKEPIAGPAASLPGAPVPPGMGLSPEAPPTPPAPGGRAPSFGAPTGEKPSSFRIGGRFYGWQTVGYGGSPANPPVGYSGTALHVPLRSVGKIPFWGGAGATLNFSYGTKYLTAYTSYYFRVSREEQVGFVNPQLGPSFGLAYLLITPDPLGPLRLSFKIGAFTEVYAGPGQWGWGIFGPLLAVRGYGETTNGEWDLTRDVRLLFTQGVLVVPGVPENFARGDYNSWIETGVSTWVHHLHVGAIVENQYTFKLHYASARGTDERMYLRTFLNTLPRDGRFDTYLGEARWQGVPWGQIGVSGGLYDFKNATAVGDGIWWGVDWTQGSREMINKFLGPLSAGNGKVAVIGAEYDFSVASILYAKARNPPRSFTGQGPDLRVAIAAMLTRTVASDDPFYKDQNGYFFGLETEYRMTSMFSMTFQAYGEDRYSVLGRYQIYSLNPGISLRTDWLSTDRIQLIYGRRFYSYAADPNSALPYDRNMLALGGYITF